MKKLTLCERIINFLIATGFTEEPSKSRKYICMLSKEQDRRYWIGRKGAVRVGKTSSNSISVTGRVAYLVKCWEKEQAGKICT